MRRFKKSLEWVRNGWESADTYFALQEASARSAHDRTKWTDQRVSSAQAHFVLMFAALEDLVSRRMEKCAKLYSDPGRPWRSRRVWGEIDPDRLVFLSKVAILTKKGDSDFNRIQTLYKQRNQIAHGNFAAVGSIALPQVYTELLGLASRLANS